MPKVRASSATMGTIRGANSLSLSRPPSMRTKAMVVDISLPSLSSANLPKLSSVGRFGQCEDFIRRRGR